jgi:uncharacterized protein YkwD
MSIKQLLRTSVFVICCYVTVVGGAELLRQNSHWRVGNFVSPQKNVLINGDDIIRQINELRVASGSSELARSPKLDQASSARLAVLLSNDDTDGSQTGLTSEKALNMVDYGYSKATDLFMLEYPSWINPVNEWLSTSDGLKALISKQTTDIGVAYMEKDGRGFIYLYLAEPARQVQKTQTTIRQVSWDGPELWQEVNKRRVQLGVNPLKLKDELCTIASIRLNQILDLKGLDGHAGFVPTLNRDDLKWISEKYNISEFLIAGYQSPMESVKAWEGTLGHRSLLAGGEFVWGCVYAQNSYGVAITAY